jgi:hypothetical protein
VPPATAAPPLPPTCVQACYACCWSCWWCGLPHSSAWTSESPIVQSKRSVISLTRPAGQHRARRQCAGVHSIHSVRGWQPLAHPQAPAEPASTRCCGSSSLQHCHGHMPCSWQLRLNWTTAPVICIPGSRGQQDCTQPCPSIIHHQHQRQQLAHGSWQGPGSSHHQ